MENKTVEQQKKKLIEKLSPQQKEYLEALDWFYNASRGAGRTYLSCTVGLLGLLNGNPEVFIIDHHPHNEHALSYVKSMIHGLADEIELAIEIKNVRNGFMIRRAPEYIQWEQYDKKKIK